MLTGSLHADLGGGPVVEYGDLAFWKGAGVERFGFLPGGVLRAAHGRRLHVVAQVVLDGQQRGADQRIVGLSVGGASAVASWEHAFDVEIPVGWVVEGAVAIDFGIEADPVGTQGEFLVLATRLLHLEAALLGQCLDIGHDGQGLG